MKTIEEEYKEHVVPEEVSKELTDPYSLVLNIEFFIKELEKEERRVLRRKRRNRLAQRVFISSKEILQEEETCYEEIVELIEELMDNYTEIAGELTEENFEEMLKLVDFLLVQYTNNKAFINGKIDSLEQAMNGITFIDNRNQDKREQVREFIKKRLASMKKEGEVK